MSFLKSPKTLFVSYLICQRLVLGDKPLVQFAEDPEGQKQDQECIEIRQDGEDEDDEKPLSSIAAMVKSEEGQLMLRVGNDEEDDDDCDMDQSDMDHEDELEEGEIVLGSSMGNDLENYEDNGEYVPVELFSPTDDNVIFESVWL